MVGTVERYGIESCVEKFMSGIDEGGENQGDKKVIFCENYFICLHPCPISHSRAMLYVKY
jgi:hypothetical protein